MYLSFGKNDSNEIKSNMAYIYQLWQILHVLERMLSRETTPSHRIKSYVTSFFLCPAFEMKDWWLDDEAGYPEGGFPFSINTVCVSFFFLLWREILDRCALTAHSWREKKWMQLFTFPVLCLRAVTVQIFSFHEVKWHKVSSCFGNWKWSSRALPRNMSYFPSLSYLVSWIRLSEQARIEISQLVFPSK